MEEWIPPLFPIAKTIGFSDRKYREAKELASELKWYCPMLAIGNELERRPDESNAADAIAMKVAFIEMMNTVRDLLKDSDEIELKDFDTVINQAMDLGFSLALYRMRKFEKPTRIGIGKQQLMNDARQAALDKRRKPMPTLGKFQSTYKHYQEQYEKESAIATAVRKDLNISRDKYFELLRELRQQKKS